jgi:threonine/homoserine/homoserine lactone efflux protein
VLLSVVYLGMGLLWLLIWMTLVGRLARYMHAPVASRVTDGLIAVVFTFFAVRLSLGA